MRRFDTRAAAILAASAAHPTDPCSVRRATRGQCSGSNVEAASPAAPSAKGGRRSGDVGRVAVAAKGVAADATPRGKRRPAATIAAGRPHPADHASGPGRVDRTRRLATAAVLSAPRGGLYSWKWDDHAHQTSPWLHWLCQTWRPNKRSPCPSDGMIGRRDGAQAETFVPKRPCYSPGLLDASLAVLPTS